MEKVEKKKLTIKWSKREKDLMFNYPSKPDGHLMHNAFSYTPTSSGKSLIEELTARGYDITTIKFSIERRADYNPYPIKSPPTESELLLQRCKDSGVHNHDVGFKGECLVCGQY